MRTSRARIATSLRRRDDHDDVGVGLGKHFIKFLLHVPRWVQSDEGQHFEIFALMSIRADPFSLADLGKGIAGDGFSGQALDLAGSLGGKFRLNVRNHLRTSTRNATMIYDPAMTPYVTCNPRDHASHATAIIFAGGDQLAIHRATSDRSETDWELSQTPNCETDVE